MRLLVDTSVWLWSLTEPSRLRPSAREAFVDPANEVHLSVASAWEIAIKHATGKLPLPAPPEVFVPRNVTLGRLSTIPVRLGHTLLAGALPRHHGDPFDRMLIAQAMIDGLTILTSDRAFSAYGVPLMPAV